MKLLQFLDLHGALSLSHPQYSHLSKFGISPGISTYEPSPVQRRLERDDTFCWGLASSSEDLAGEAPKLPSLSDPVNAAPGPNRKVAHHHFVWYEFSLG